MFLKFAYLNVHNIFYIQNKNPHIQTSPNRRYAFNLRTCVNTILTMCKTKSTNRTFIDKKQKKTKNNKNLHVSAHRNYSTIILLSFP